MVSFRSTLIYKYEEENLIEMNLKRLQSDEFFDIAHFNDNFAAIEAEFAAIRAVQNTPSIVYGTMSANGAVVLGFRPMCVLVMSRRILLSISAGNATRWFPMGGNFAMAHASSSGGQRRRNPATGGEGAVLSVTDTGFTVSEMFGSLDPSATNPELATREPVSISAVLRYVAWR
jgi:hypothetical protein